MGGHRIAERYFCACGTEIFRKGMHRPPLFCAVCNAEKKRQYHNTYWKHRYHTDPAFRARCMEACKKCAKKPVDKIRKKQYHAEYVQRPDIKDRLRIRCREYYRSHPEFRARRLQQMKAQRDRQKQLRVLSIELETEGVKNK